MTLKALYSLTFTHIHPVHLLAALFFSSRYLNSSQGTIGCDMEVCETLQGYASPDHHWQTGHAGWCYRQHNVYHSFSRVFHACSMCSVWRNRAPMADLPILANAKRAARYWAATFCRVSYWQWSSWSSSHKGADTGPAARLMPFYGPVQLSLCNCRSPGVSSMLLTLCWETEQTFLRPHLWMCPPGGAGLPVQPDQAAVTTSCYQ